MSDTPAAKLSALKESREKLLAEKFSLLSQMSVTLKENERITDWNVVLEGRLNDAMIEMEATQVILRTS